MFGRWYWVIRAIIGSKQTRHFVQLHLQLKSSKEHAKRQCEYFVKKNNNISFTKGQKINLVISAHFKASKMDASSPNTNVYSACENVTT